MPIYEYICRDCSKKFEALVQGKHRPVCPKCKSPDLEQQLSVFAVAGGSSKTKSADAQAGPCGTCGDPRGPGACSLDS